MLRLQLEIGLLVVLLGFSSCTEKPPLGALPPNGSDTLVSFASDVRPLLTQHGCATSSCHGTNPGQSNYSVLTYASFIRPGDEANRLGMFPVREGKPDSSYVVWKLEGPGVWPIIGTQMPQLRPPMGPADIALIRAWIRQGAQDN
jgi:hypothetical protein